MKKLLTYIFVIAVFSTVNIYAQYGFGTENPDASAVIDVSGADKGMLVPRVALSQTSSSSPVSSPATSLLVYNTATAGDVTPGYYYWNGSKWVRMINQDDENGLWISSGNDIYNGNSGNVGIGTNSPGKKLDIVGEVRVDISTGKIEMGDLNTFNVTSNVLVLDADNGYGGFYDNEEKMWILRTDGDYVYVPSKMGVGIDPTSVVTDNTLFNVSNGASTADIVNFFDNSTEVFTIIDGGFVGVGTSAPDTNYLMDVYGKLRSIRYIMGTGPDLSLLPVVGGQSVLSSWWTLQIVGNRQANVDYTPSNIGNRDDASVIIPNQQASKIGLIIMGQTSQTGNLTEWQNNSGTGLSAVDKDGNFGIGTTSPSTKLHVVGSIRMVDGNQGTGKVLNSDANGVGSWKNLVSTDSHNGISTGTDGGVYMENYIKAMGKVNSNGTAASIMGASVSRRNTGDYRITFNSQMPDANYVIILTIHDFGGTGRDDPGITYLNQTTTRFDVHIQNNDDGNGGGSDTDYEFMFVVLDFNN